MLLMFGRINDQLLNISQNSLYKFFHQYIRINSDYYFMLFFLLSKMKADNNVMKAFKNIIQNNEQAQSITTLPIQLTKSISMPHLNKKQQSNLQDSQKIKSQQQRNDDDPAAWNLLSKIFRGSRQVGSKTLPTEFIFVKNNILLVFLCISFYGLYYLLGGFIDTILLALIAGIAYQVLRDSFVQYITKGYKEYKIDSWKYRIFVILMMSIFVFVLPWISKILGKPDDIWTYRSFKHVKKQFFRSYKQQNKAILYIQIAIALYIVKLIIGQSNIDKLFKILSKIISVFEQQRRIVIAKKIFACCFFLIVIVISILIPLAIYRELRVTGEIIQVQVQLSFNCSLVSNSSSGMQHCTQKLDLSQFLKSGIQEIKAQNQTINQCVSYSKKIQQRVFGYEIISEAEGVCTWVSMLDKANKYFNENTRNMVLSTSQNIFSIVFGNLTALIFLLSDIIFNLTTFATVFYVTVNYFNSQKNFFSQIISDQHQHLYNNIANLLYATFFIVVEHFLMTFVVLEIFNFSPVNLLLSLCLCSMSLVPLFRPWFGMLVFAAINFVIGNIRSFLSLGQFLTTLDLYVALLLAGIYYFLSQKIYSINYLKMDANQIIMNLSILFGIYQFGVAGIIYGPLIMIGFSCVSTQLLSQKNTNANAQNKPVINV